MVELVRLDGSLNFGDGAEVVSVWLNKLSDFEKLKSTFGGIFSTSETSRGVLYSLFVPSFRVRFLCLVRGGGDGKR
ncbi:hypothetical protein TEU_11720 (plasmid) [Thermococcus eurythermalis]|uniref:Uncharacterized protein n=1 Tax=Thermococcus eurythermalis TaxID=1505907 RepID=A0A097QWS6_9EURY|nr:hypothetical protein [Thermococcus eurythermalis]AIU70940.1 hypothetical protein TEU_11720 [Thermococcus eurythermalis]ATW69294.1 hypothetical protein CJF57_00131 [Staphylococcus phage UPMK_1]